MTPVQKIFRVVAFLGYFLFGAWDVANAVRHYKSERYLLFGVDVMLTFYMMLLSVMLYIT